MVLYDAVPARNLGAAEALLRRGALDAVLLWERGDAVAAALYVVGSVFLSLVALVGGLALVRGLS